MHKIITHKQACTCQLKTLSLSAKSRRLSFHLPSSASFMRDLGAQVRFLSFFGLLLLGLLSSCGYHFGQGEGLASRYPTITVPYVVGDINGALTSAIIQEVVRSGSFEYRTCNATLSLSIILVDQDEDHIGFRYDRKKKGDLTRDIIPTETRKIELVEVSVIDTNSNCVVLGPVRMSACVDFDHDYYFSRDGINTFSLGQLSDIDQAYDTVQTPLNRLLAKKIVAYISQSW